MFNHDIYAFLNFFLYVFYSLTALFLFVKIFVYITPHDNIQKIKDGDVPQAIMLGGVSLGFTIPLLSASYSGASVFGFLELVLIIGLFQILLEKILDKILTKNLYLNTATAILHAFFSICVGLICAFSIIP